MTLLIIAKYTSVAQAVLSYHKIKQCAILYIFHNVISPSQVLQLVCLRGG